MGLETALLIGAAVVGAGTVIEGQRDAKAAARYSQQAQARAASEQRAANASEAARERRAQVREERVRRARILQTAQNTGTSDSSGELGALGSLSTNLGAGIGTNLGKIQTAQNLSIFGQQQADAQTGLTMANLKVQQGQFIMSQASNIATIGGSIAGSSIFKTELPMDKFLRTGTSGD
jgi:hypothetical protein